MDEKDIQKLITHYINGKATKEEQHIVEFYFKSFEPTEDEIKEAVIQNEDNVKQRMFTNIYDLHTASKRKHRFVWVPLRIAALLVFMLTSGAGLYSYFNRSTENIVVDLPPGNDKAILELADGSIVDLESTAPLSIPKQGSVVVTKVNGQLAYNGEAQSTESVYNKIVTPRGGQYLVTLADGTKVWLNASSSLRYPVAFAEDARKVELTGEGYFEVASNPDKPFKVFVHDMQVQVLGTHFNIMSYPEEEATLTTLLEGEVIVTSPSKGQVKLLPNEQAQLSQEGNLMVIKNVDVDQTVAWKNGLFVFDDTGIETIMRQVSRWYDVDIVYEGDLKYLSFVGDVPRKSNVTAILRPMELTGAVNFEIRQNTIVVKPGKKLLK